MYLDPGGAQSSLLLCEVTHSFIGNSLNKQPLDVAFSSKLTGTVTESAGLIVPLQLGAPLNNKESFSQKRSCLSD